MNDEELPGPGAAAPLEGLQARCVAGQARGRAANGSWKRTGLVVLFILLACCAAAFWSGTAASRGLARWTFLPAVGTSYWVLWISGLAARRRYPARRGPVLPAGALRRLAGGAWPAGRAATRAARRPGKHPDGD